MSFLKNIFIRKKKRDFRQRTRKSKQLSKLSKTVAGKSKVDDAVLDNLEEILVASDVRVDTTLKLLPVSKVVLRQINI
jgi:fused signal recognition particle receptor